MSWSTDGTTKYSAVLLETRSGVCSMLKSQLLPQASETAAAPQCCKQQGHFVVKLAAALMHNY